MGRALAEELASQGFNIVLMARNEQRTNAVADEIRKQYNVKTKVLLYDFSNLNDATSVQQLEDVLAQVKDLDISILVNNVGYIEFKPFHLME